MAAAGRQSVEHLTAKGRGARRTEMVFNEEGAHRNGPQEGAHRNGFGTNKCYLYVHENWFSRASSANQPTITQGLYAAFQCPHQSSSLYNDNLVSM